jgi:hypothetical protein
MREVQKGWQAGIWSPFIDWGAMSGEMIWVIAEKKIRTQNGASANLRHRR